MSDIIDACITSFDVPCRLVLPLLVLVAGLPLPVVAETCAAPNPAELKSLRHAVDAEPLQPRAIARVHTEGTLPHQGIWDQSLAAERDWPLMLNLARLYRAEHRPDDLKRAEALLTAWAVTYRPSYNPIDETGLDAMIDAYRLLDTDLDPKTRSAVSSFLKTLGNGYLTRLENDLNPAKGSWINNWTSHRVKLAALTAFALHDPAMIQRAKMAFIAQINRNIGPEGETVDFRQRDALHYVVYDLEPLVRVAVAAKEQGMNWYGLKGASGGDLEKALAWLKPYAMGEKTHLEFVHSTVPFDAARRKAGVKGFEGLWQPKRALRLYRMAAMLDPRYQPIVDQLGGRKECFIR
ncbi:alginate lyase family protein [Allorhizobium sonneratiae]|uniref:alginate lyase family protein n=1 Tax=Allorhizobium sonneratiae TaxID=2934936 RepID=UPI0020346919|nr:alginate lyase family protein [Allorhizobium sonneratiae]